MALNHISIMGRMVRVPELRHTNSNTPVCSFTLAVDRDFQSGEKQTDFIDCVAWKHTAEFVSKYFQKGTLAIVAGRLQMREWVDQHGNKRRNAEVVADNIYFGESKKRDDYNHTEKPRYVENPTLEDMDDDESELPF